MRRICSILHDPGRFLDVAVGTDANRIGRHHLADLGVGTEALRDRAHGDVAIGDDADQAAAVDHRHRAIVAAVHLRRHRLQRVLQLRGIGIGSHDLGNLHACLLRWSGP
jgi:hypothetical protein